MIKSVFAVSYWPRNECEQVRHQGEEEINGVKILKGIFIFMFQTSDLKNFYEIG